MIPRKARSDRGHGGLDPLNVLFLFVTMPIGGAEQLCLEILGGIDSARFNPTVCCIGDKGILGEEAERSGVEVIELKRMRSKRFDFGTVSDLADLMASRRIDILHSNMYHANLYGRLGVLWMKGRRPRTIAAVHSLYTQRKHHRLLINRFLNRRTDCILTVSEAARNDILRYEKVSADKVIVLPPGRDFTHLDAPLTRAQAKQRIGLCQADFVVGTVGRLVAAKGHRFLLEAAKILFDGGMDFKLLIVGGGPLESSLKRQLSSLELEGRVQLLGMRRDVPELLRALDVFVMSSVSEAAGLSLVEAMAAGLPCVATTAGGMAGLVDGGRCGLLAPPGDAPALAAALADLIRCETRRAQLGQAAFLRARELFSREAMIKKLESIYLSLNAREVGMIGDASGYRDG